MSSISASLWSCLGSTGRFGGIITTDEDLALLSFLEDGKGRRILSSFEAEMLRKGRSVSGLLVGQGLFCTLFIRFLKALFKF